MEKGPGLRKEWILAGRILYEKDLVDSHSGNLSVRLGDRIWITRAGALLGYLTEEDWISLPLEAGDDVALSAGTSSEWPIHRTLYRRLPEIESIIHAHPPYLTAWGWVREEYEPEDLEGRTHVGQVPVLLVRVSGREVGQAMADRAVLGASVLVLRGHGAFSLGKTVDAALKRMVAAERSAQLSWLWRMLETRREGKG
jgi:L-fuculose-phosphate aldolase